MNNFPPKCVLIQMLEHSMYLLKNTELFDCFKKSWAPTVLEFGLFFFKSILPVEKPRDIWVELTFRSRHRKLD